MKQLKKGFNKLIDGVCSGIAEYYECDVNIIRLMYILFIICFPIPAILFYIIEMIVIPDWDE